MDVGRDNGNENTSKALALSVYQEMNDAESVGARWRAYRREPAAREG